MTDTIINQVMKTGIRGVVVLLLVIANIVGELGLFEVAKANSEILNNAMLIALGWLFAKSSE